jgi:hypothetical protein
MLALCMSRFSRRSLGMFMETHARGNAQSIRLDRQAYQLLTSTTIALRAVRLCT